MCFLLRRFVKFQLTFDKTTKPTTTTTTTTAAAAAAAAAATTTTTTTTRIVFVCQMSRQVGEVVGIQSTTSGYVCARVDRCGDCRC